MSIGRELVDQWAIKPADTTLITDHVMSRVSDALNDRLDPSAYRLDASGSQKNGTSIPGPSDCDLILRLNQQYPGIDTVSSHLDRQRAIMDLLEKKLGKNTVELSLKCLNIDKSDFPPTDIVVCKDLPVTLGGRSVDAIQILTNEHNPNRIISYPALHFTNGNEKNTLTEGAAKQLVRVLKNAREALQKNDTIGPVTAPSYMIESSVYSMPDHLFTGDPYEDLQSYIRFMLESLHTDTTTPLLAGSKVYPLIGHDTHTQWGIENAKTFVRALYELAA